MPARGEKGLPAVRILYVTPAFPPFVGGGERYARDLAIGLSRRGIEIAVVTSNAVTESDLWTGASDAIADPCGHGEARLRVRRLTCQGLGLGRAGLLARRKAMVLLSGLPGDQSRALRRQALSFPRLSGLSEALDSMNVPDLVHAFNLSWEGPMVAAHAWARRHNVPFVVTPFLHVGHRRGRRVLRNHTMDHQLFLLRDADAVLALTSIERDALVGLGVRPDRVHVVGAGIDLPSRQESGKLSRTHPSDREAPAEILFLGRVCREKGAFDAARAVGRLVDEGASVRLVLAGAISRPFMRFWCSLRDAHRAAILLLGVVDERTKAALLSRATALVLPSAVESFGLVVLEAWAYGKPVIVARAGALPAVVTDGENGLLVEYGDPVGLAAAIERLLGNDGLASCLGAAGREKLLRMYRWDHVVERVEHAYADALQRAAK